MLEKVSAAAKAGGNPAEKAATVESKPLGVTRAGAEVASWNQPANQEKGPLEKAAEAKLAAADAAAEKAAAEKAAEENAVSRSDTADTETLMQ